MRIITLLFCFLLTFFYAHSQDKTYIFHTFKDTRVINTHTIETLAARKLDIRIGHRFGDMFGTSGGWPTFYGLETATDVMIGAEYGFSDKLMAGFSRTKGAGNLKQNLNYLMKYRLLRQSNENGGASITALGLFSLSTMEKRENTIGVNNFSRFSHRMAYTFQLLIAKKFSERFSFQAIPSYTHRNIVENFDKNGIFSLGFATRLQLNKVLGIIADTTIPLTTYRSPFFTAITEDSYYVVIGIGLEIETGGHVFQVNFTNARGIMETDYIPYNNNNWTAGQFRLGFTVSRLFNL